MVTLRFTPKRATKTVAQLLGRILPLVTQLVPQREQMLGTVGASFVDSLLVELRHDKHDVRQDQVDQVELVLLVAARRLAAGGPPVRSLSQLLTGFF